MKMQGRLLVTLLPNQRRPNQSQRKDYARSQCSSVGTSSSPDCATNSEAQQTDNPDTSEIFLMSG